ncbi:MAG: glycosyltransferase [Candidatus Omnitrophica bacterium]|jgi:GT2 family glycosyltransferase|nr:glycosyltransferase [Candidatus Omnitrophota bacterium]
MDVSVVVPTCGRIEKLRACLFSLFTQDYPKKNTEIIVIDDRASRKTKDLTEELKKYFPQLKYLSQRRKGPAAARNLGAKNSQGEIIAYVDDDCVVENNWLKLMVEAQQKNPNIVVVGGKTLTANQKTTVLVSQFLSNCSIESYIDGKKEVIFFPTCNVSFKRAVFDKYRFDETFPLPGGEDLEFFWRLFKDGYRFIWDKDIKVIHYRDDTFFSFMKQAYIYGRGNLLAQYLHKDHPLLHELRTEKKIFWLATFINTLKIPRFAQLLGVKLIKEEKIKGKFKKIAIYLYFILHKIFYIFGNIFEYFRVKKDA